MPIFSYHCLLSSRIVYGRVNEAVKRMKICEIIMKANTQCCFGHALDDP